MASAQKPNEMIGARIRDARERAGMSQIELARELGFQSATAISFIESGDRRVTAEMLSKMASILDIPAQALLGHQVEQPNIRFALRADKALTRDDEGKIIDYIEWIKSKRRGR